MKILYDIKTKDEYGRLKELFISSYDDKTYEKIGFKGTFGLELISSHRVTNIRFKNPVYDKLGINVGLGDIREMTRKEMIDKGLIIEIPVIEDTMENKEEVNL